MAVHPKKTSPHKALLLLGWGVRPYSVWATLLASWLGYKDVHIGHLLWGAFQWHFRAVAGCLSKKVNGYVASVLPILVLAQPFVWRSISRQAGLCIHPPRTWRLWSGPLVIVVAPSLAIGW